MGRLRRGIAMGLGMGVSYGGRRAPVPVTLLSDAFTDPDATALTSHTPNVGGAYTALIGALDIRTNKCAPLTLSGGECAARNDVGENDVTITVPVTPGAGSFGTGVVGRCSDASNFWLVRVANDVNRNQIIDKQAGVYVVRAFGAVAIADGVTYALEAIFAGDLITARVDGANEISFNSSFNQAATGVGPYFAGANDLLDDLVVVG